MLHDRSEDTPRKWKHHTLFTAISASLAAGTSPATEAQQSEAAGAERLEEVIVTARKREESIQDIPQSIQAFSQKDIQRAGIKGLTDVAKFVPSMTVVGQSAGLNKIVFRGLADSVRPFIADSSAAIYLDEQPLTTGAQSPEIRPIDLERIESLAGPQGTLYGASSQSGTVRYIVAKPDASQFEANVGGGIHTIDHGDTGWDADAMINIPVIPDKFAIRLVGFGARDAGFIDNVLSNTPGRIEWSTGTYVPGSKTNAALVEDDFNKADWYGGRLSAKWHINDEWSLTGIYNYSHSDIDGYNNFDPTVGDLETTKFNRETWDDEWYNFQFTIDGELGFASLTSSTAYFERDTAYQFDGTFGVAYYHSVWGYYGRGTCGSNPYYAYYNIYDFATACELNGVGYDVNDGDPTGTWRNVQTDDRWTHETRLSGSTSRWDWTVGFFYQEANQLWVYDTTIDGFADTEAFAAFEAIYGDLEPTDARWNSSEQSERKDTAVFGETTVNLSEQWKLLLGLRWYDTEIERRYIQGFAGAPPVVTTPSGADDGWLPKFGVQYFFADDKMLYALYSEGFRAGGINRARGNPTLPIEYDSDLLKNYEAGLKSQWMDGRLQFNLIGYHQVWEDMQLELSDPSWFCCGEPFQTVIANVGEAVVDGMDAEITWVPTAQLSLGLVATYLFKAEIDEDIEIFDERAPDFVALDIPKGTRLPLVADLNLAMYAEYGWNVDWFGGGETYLRFQYAYTGASWNALRDFDFDPDGDGYGGRVKTDSYEIADLRAGFSNADWEFTAYVDNFMDERAITYRPMGAAVFWGQDNVRTLRPRTFGINVRRYFR